MDDPMTTLDQGAAETLLADMLALEGVKDGRGIARRYLREVGFSDALRRLAWIREYVDHSLAEGKPSAQDVLFQVQHMATPSVHESREVTR